MESEIISANHSLTILDLLFRNIPVWFILVTLISGVIMLAGLASVWAFLLTVGSIAYMEVYCRHPAIRMIGILALFVPPVYFVQLTVPLSAG